MGVLIEVQRLTELPAELFTLVAESERAGYRFLRRLLDEWQSGLNRFDRQGEGLFGARADTELVGVCGLNIDPYAGDGEIGRIRHLYVLEAWRRSGVGRKLVERAVAAAQPRFRQLRLRTDTAAAARFYERLGFSAVAHESATHAWP